MIKRKIKKMWAVIWPEGATDWEFFVSIYVKSDKDKAIEMAKKTGNKVIPVEVRYEA